MDFDTYDSIDPLRIFDSNSLGSYYKFLKKYEKEYTVNLDSSQELFIEFISKKFASGKRPHELLLIKSILDGKDKLISCLKNTLLEEYGISFKPTTETNVVNILTNEFPTGTGKKHMPNVYL